MSLFFFFAVFAFTIFLQQWLHRHIQAFAYALTGNPGCALRLLFYLLLPGIYLHEFSHYVTARLLFVRVKRFDVGIGRERKAQVSLGSVQIARTDPVRESLIGAAPFIVGITAIWLIAYLGFGLGSETGFSLDRLWTQARTYSHNWLSWANLYLIFAVSTAMIPSESDREPWGLVLVVGGILIAILFLLGWTPRVPSDWVAMAWPILDALTFALGISVVVNGAVALTLWILERTVERIKGKRVEYRVNKK